MFGRLSYLLRLVVLCAGVIAARPLFAQIPVEQIVVNRGDLQEKGITTQARMSRQGDTLTVSFSVPEDAPRALYVHMQCVITGAEISKTTVANADASDYPRTTTERERSGDFSLPAADVSRAYFAFTFACSTRRGLPIVRRFLLPASALAPK